MTIINILDTAREQLEENLKNESDTTRDYFKALEDGLKTKTFLLEQEEGLENYIDIKIKEETKIKEMEELLSVIATESDIEDAGAIISKVITKNNWFHKRLFETEDRLVFKKTEENTTLYFYPFKDGEAYYGYVSELDNGFIYFTGVVIQHEFYYELIDVLQQEFRSL